MWWSQQRVTCTFTCTPEQEPWPRAQPRAQSSCGLSPVPCRYDLEAEDLRSGLPVPLSYYEGRVMLIVNVASACGFTDSTYSILNELHSRYASRGLAILAFPCNQFGQQEPGSSTESAPRTRDPWFATPCHCNERIVVTIVLQSSHLRLARREPSSTSFARWK